MKEIFGNINYLAMIAGGIAYWLVGMIWFTVLFGRTWAIEILKYGIRIQPPTKKIMVKKSITTFIFNQIVAFGIAIFFSALGVNTLIAGIGFGLGLGIFFAAMALATSYVWVSRSCKLSMIDIGYPVAGILAASIIIALWR